MQLASQDVVCRLIVLWQASRLETTGQRDRIHLSQETADLLVVAGKERWIVQRAEKVVAKGKGELSTYWLRCDVNRSSNGSNRGMDQSYMDETTAHSDGMDDDMLAANLGLSGKTVRLIDWSVDILSRLVCQIIDHRVARQAKETKSVHHLVATLESSTHNALDEVQDIVILPDFAPSESKKKLGSRKTVIQPNVHSQLYDLVTTIASMYRENPFHNFEHATHVTMSVRRL